MKRGLLHKDEIYSQGAFEILMEYELIRTIRYPTPISLIYLEMKSQAEAGMASRSILSVFETAINLQLRLVDIPARYGTGYLILLPATNEDGARALCERLLRTFAEEFKTEDGKTVRFLLQIGIASHSGGPTLMKETLIQAAETSLQRSRMMGSNMIGIA